MNRRDFTKLIGLTSLAASLNPVAALARKPAPQFSITMDDFYWQNAVKLTGAERNQSILDTLREMKLPEIVY